MLTFASKYRYTVAAGAAIFAVTTLAIVRASEAPGSPKVTVRMAGPATQHLHVRDGADIQAVFSGAQPAVDALRSGSAQPLSLATADLDNDGAPDLLVGYGVQGRGVIAIHPGNIDAFAPTSPAAYQAVQSGKIPASFQPAARLFDLPEPADFLVVRDFNGHGTQDIVAAARGGGLYLIPGDGHGGFGAAQPIPLPGGVTAIAAGQFNLPHEAADIAVGVNGPAGPALLLFDGAAGGLQSQPLKYSLAAAAVSLAFDQLDNDGYSDLAIAAGDSVVILHGQDPSAGLDLASRAEPIHVGFTIRSLTLGSFTWNRDNKRSIAVLTDTGSVLLLERNDLDTRPFSAAESAALKRNALDRLETPAAVAQTGPSVHWSVGRSLDAGLSTTASGPAGQLIAASQIAPQEMNDLLVVDSAGATVNVVLPAGRRGLVTTSDSNPADLSTISMQVDAAPTAALAMPRKVNGERDLIVLTSGRVAPHALPMTSGQTITVDRTDDSHTSACTAAANDCSLRGAIDFANSNAGTTINVPAGTYQITIASTNEANNLNGDLDVKASGTTIVGAGAATTIIQETLVARVMDINFASAANFTFSISGVTITGGQDNSGFGGGGFLTGGSANSYTITNCIFDTNKVLGTGTSAPGGAVSLSIGGSLQATGSTFSNNNAGTNEGGAIFMLPTTDTATTLVLQHDTFTNNQSTGDGGAVSTELNGGTSTYNASVTDSSFTNNKVVAGSIITGGGAFFIDNGSGNVMNVQRSTFVGNQDTDANGHGGAVAISSGLNHFNFNRFVNNTTATAANGNTVFNTGPNADFVDNWWGNLSGPKALDATGTTLVTTSPSLTLTITPTSSNIVVGGQTALTASFLTDTGSNSVVTVNLATVIGLPIAFGATGGNITGADITVQSTATAAATFNATTGGSDSATATVDSATASAAINVSNPTTHFSVSAPSAATAGTSFNFTVAALDQFNNTTTGYTGVVHFTSVDGQAVLPADSTLSNGTGNFSATLKTAGVQTISATDTTTSSITGTSGSITVSPSSSTRFTVSAPGAATAGTAFNFTVTALDPFSNTATGYTGTVHFTSTDGQAVLPANSTLTNGTGTVSATLKTAGSQNLTATDTTNSSITGTSNSITVSTATATHFTVSAPSAATAGTAFNFTVIALDQFNNTATGYAGTVHFTSTDGQAVLPANSTLTNGTGTFAATLKTAGNQTITATDAVTSSVTGTSNSIAVSSTTATHFTVSAPGSATAGNAFNLTVTAQDAFNNTATGYSGTAHFTSTDGQAVLPANSTLSNGTGTFSATLKTAGIQTITATDTVSSSITGTSNSITVSAAAATHLTVSAPATATAGSAFNFTVTAQDAFSNTATGYSGTVHFTSTDGQAVLPANSTLTSGAGTLSATLKTAGNQTITALDTVTGSINGTSGGISVVSPPTISKSFGAASIPLNGTTTLSFTITNPAANTVGLTGIAFTDSLPAGLVVATPANPSTACGGTFTATAGANSVSLTGGSIGTPGATCTLSLNVTGVSGGVQSNTVTSITSTNGGTGLPSNTAMLSVGQPPAISVQFVVPQIFLGASTNLLVTIANANPFSLTGIGMSDVLPAGLILSPGYTPTTTCGGSLTSTSGSVTLTAGTLSAGATCTVLAAVIGTQAGTLTDMATVTSNEGGANPTPATAAILVIGQRSPGSRDRQGGQ